MLGKPLSALCAVALICAPHFATAANFTVNDPTEFQTALTTAQANGESDTITVGAATFNIAANGTLTYTAAATENFSLTITGGPQALAILDGGSQVPILRIDSTAVINDGGVNFDINNLTFRNGNATGAPNDDGGALAILTDESQQPAEFATIVFIVGCEFFDNAAADDGGAVYVRAHAVEGIYLDDLTFDGNQAGGDGGAAYVAGGMFTTPQFYNNIDFYNSMAQGSGGGLVAEGFDAATPTTDLANSVSFFDISFYNNQSMSATEGGGGADVSSLATFIDTVGFIDNQARVGGGLRIRPSWSSIAMTNTGFVGNTASEDGGAFAALETFFQSFTMTNNTIFQNTATNRGGGALVLIDSSSSIAEIYNNIIYGNTVTQGTGADLYLDNQVFNDIGAPVELFNNDITDFVVTPVVGVFTQGSNIDQAPSFVDMAARPVPDPRLQSGSAGIDVGDDNAPGAPAVDFESDSRPFDGDGDMTATIDMGMDEFTGAVVQNADLVVTKTDSPDPVVENTNVTYTVVVTNGGPGAASGVTLVDTLDPLVTYVSATPTQGTCAENTGTVTCSLGALADNASATVTIVVTAPAFSAAQQLTNTASVSATEPDPVSSNNSSTELTTVVEAGAPTADLAVTKTDSPDPVLLDGSTVTYTITVTNNGPDAATGVTMSDTLPPVGAAFQSVSTDTGQCDAQPDGNGMLDCTIGDLAVDGIATVTIVVLPTGLIGPQQISYEITNTVTVSGTEVDPTPANNTATEDSTVNPPVSDMSVSTTHAPDSPMVGEQLTYSITVDNNGPLDNTGVVLTVTLPASATFVSASIDTGSCGDVSDGTVTCTIGDMASGVSVVAQIIVTAPGEATTLTLSATLVADVADPTPGDNVSSEAVTVIDVVDLIIEGTSEGSGSITLLELLFATMAGLAVYWHRRREAARQVLSMMGLAALAALLVLPAQQAVAQNQWYVGANIGASDADYSSGELVSDLASLGWTINNPSVDDTDTAWKAYAGFSFNEYVAVEGGYADLGKVETRFGATVGPNQIDAILTDTYSIHPVLGDGWFGTVVLSWPVSPDQFSLTARAGFFAWESDIDVEVVQGGTGRVSGDDDGTDMLYGLGFEWHMNAQWSLTAEWERYELKDTVDVPSIGLKYNF